MYHMSYLAVCETNSTYNFLKDKYVKLILFIIF